MTKLYRLAKIRQAIPALSQMHHASPVVYLNGPGGTQVPTCVPEAMANYLLNLNSNVGAPFLASIQTGKILDEARQGMAAFLNAKDAKEISFGQNMTSVVFNFARALSQAWSPGDNIILTELDHDSNVSPWALAARDRGVEVRYWPVNLDSIELNTEDLLPLLNHKTKFVGFTMASNLVGSMVDVKTATQLAQNHGAHVFIDVTHACAHMPIDVQMIGCNSLACSAYKFSGPHLGILYVRLDSASSISPYKVPDVSEKNPGQFEQGTQNFEGLAGLLAILKYKASMAGDGELTTANFHAAMQMIFDYERTLIRHFLNGVDLLAKEFKFERYGLFNPEADSALYFRTPTFAFRFPNQRPEETALWFAKEGLFTASGHFHCSGLMNKLNLQKTGGVWRLGFAYYTSLEEIDRLLDAMRRCLTEVSVLNTSCILS